MDAQQQAELKTAVDRYRAHGLAVIAGDFTKSPYYRDITGSCNYESLVSDERVLAQAYLAYIAEK